MVPVDRPSRTAKPEIAEEIEVLADALKARFNAEPGKGYLPMREAIKALGVSRQTVLQRVKRGELEAVHVTRGRQKGLRIKVIGRQAELFA